MAKGVKKTRGVHRWITAHTHARTHIHSNTKAPTHTHEHTHARAHTYTLSNTHTHTHTHTRTHTKDKVKGGKGGQTDQGGASVDYSSSAAFFSKLTDTVSGEIEAKRTAEVRPPYS